MKRIILLLSALLLASPLYAEETVAPGSMWNSFGTTPLEQGNHVDYFHVDQGVVAGRVKSLDMEPYVALNVTRDTLSHPWNNKEKIEAGVKLVKSFPHGVVDVGLAYASEHRHGLNVAPSETRSGPIFFTTGWFGYGQEVFAKPDKKFFSETPGSFQWVVGNISPFEKNNVIGQARIEQGVTVMRIKEDPVSLLYWGQVGFDSQGMPWNDRYINGVGMKIEIPWTSGVAQVVGGYECGKSYRSDMPASCGPTVKFDLWAGWRKKMGGV